MKTKICTKCKQELPLTSEYFYKRKEGKLGFKSSCKQCCCESRKISHLKHRDKELKYKKQYYRQNKKVINEKKKQYCEDNKEHLIEYRKLRYKNNKTRLNAERQNYRENNREKDQEYCRLWQSKNKDKVCAYSQKRRMLKRQLPATLTVEQWQKIKEHFNNKCAYCGKELPLQQEHFVPLSKGGEYTKNNIIPACRSCNSSKCNKYFNEWYPKYKYYSKKREIKILDFINRHRS